MPNRRDLGCHTSATGCRVASRSAPVAQAIAILAEIQFSEDRPPPRNEMEAVVSASGVANSTIAKKGRGQTMTHDYQRNGTTTLFAALDVATGKVIGSCLPKHRHIEFLKFLRTVDNNVPAGLDRDSREHPRKSRPRPRRAPSSQPRLRQTTTRSDLVTLAARVAGNAVHSLGVRTLYVHDVREVLALPGPSGDD